MTLSDESVQEYKAIYKKQYGKDITDDEAREQAQRVIDLMMLLIDMDRRERMRKEKLKLHPEGFHYTDGKTYSCPVCGKQIKNEEIWYDDCGFKCMDCQRNLKKHILPKSVFKNRDSWYSFWHLEDKFGITKKEARKMLKEGKLRARVLKSDGGHPYQYIFLKKENAHLGG